MSTNPMFVRTVSGVKNISLATSVIFEGEHLIALDEKCRVVLFEKGEASDGLFKRIQKLVEPSKDSSLLLENGSWIDVGVIANAYISSKSECLLVSGLNGKLLCMFKPEEYSDLEGLRDAVTDALCQFSEGESLPDINWSEYKA